MQPLKGGHRIQFPGKILKLPAQAGQAFQILFKGGVIKSPINGA